jgi:hypothetical protein
MTDITAARNLNPQRRHRTCPRAVKKTNRTPYRAKTPRDKNITHHGPPAIRLVNLPEPQAAA